ILPGSKKQTFLSFWGKGPSHLLNIGDSELLLNPIYQLESNIDLWSIFCNYIVFDSPRTVSNICQMNGVNYSNLTTLIPRSFLTATTFNTFELMLEQLTRAHLWITYSEPGKIKWNSSQWILIDSLTESVVLNETNSWSSAVQTDLNNTMKIIFDFEVSMFGIFFVIICTYFFIANAMTQNLEQEIKQMCDMLISIPRVYAIDIKSLKAAMDEQEKISSEEINTSISILRLLKILWRSIINWSSLNNIENDIFKIKTSEDIRQGKSKPTDKITVNLIFGTALKEESELGENSVLSDSSEELNSTIESPSSPVLSPKYNRISRTLTESKSLASLALQMTTIHAPIYILQNAVDRSSEFMEVHKHFTDIAEALCRARRCVVVTGAGISVSGGIPDFRSSNGLYNLVKDRYPESVVKGKELFDATLFKDPIQTEIFYSFMGELKEIVSKAKVTATHRFLKRLDDQGKLLRCYTQNIDCLEQRLSLSANIDDKNSRIVQLHGDLDTVICNMCQSLYDFSPSMSDTFKGGQPPVCPNCQELYSVRAALGKRSIRVGTLRPNIVLYNEYHVKGEKIADITICDIKKKPDLLIVMGTSLKVHGIKRLVKDLAKTVHERKGKVIFINRTELSRAEWEGVFDYYVQSNTDDAVEALELECSRIQAMNLRSLEKRLTKPKLKVQKSSISSVNDKNSSREITQFFFPAKSTPTKSIETFEKSTSLPNIKQHADIFSIASGTFSVISNPKPAKQSNPQKKLKKGSHEHFNLLDISSKHLETALPSESHQTVPCFTLYSTNDISGIKTTYLNSDKKRKMESRENLMSKSQTFINFPVIRPSRAAATAAAAAISKDAFSNRRPSKTYENSRNLTDPVRTLDLQKNFEINKLIMDSYEDQDDKEIILQNDASSEFKEDGSESLNYSTMEQTLFDLMFAMVFKNDAVPDTIQYLFNISEDIQFAVLVFETEYGLPLSPSSLKIIHILGFSIDPTSWDLIYTSRSLRDSSGAVWPLRTLRIFTAALITLLYQSIVDILFFGLACDPNNGSLLRLPSESPNDPSCWSPQQIPFTLISIVTLSWFLPVCIALGSTYFESEPALHDSRSHGRIDFCYLIVRTLVVAANSILYGKNSAVTKKMIINGAARRMEIVLAQENDILQSANQINEFFSDFEIFGPKKLDSRIIVFRRWTDMEICMRHIFEDIRHHHRIMNSEDVAKIYQFVDQASKDHPNSSGIYVHAAVYLKNYYTDTPLISIYLRKAAEIGPAIDLKFIVYMQQRQIEQKRQRNNTGIDKGLKVIDEFEHKKYWRSAKKYHKSAAELIVQAWLYVLKTDGDLLNLPNYARVRL
ncbi:hypothetical protein HK096_008058, partial [Nowakowskiella sp. JEL0078]